MAIAIGGHFGLSPAEQCFLELLILFGLALVQACLQTLLHGFLQYYGGGNADIIALYHADHGYGEVFISGQAGSFTEAVFLGTHQQGEGAGVVDFFVGDGSFGPFSGVEGEALDPHLVQGGLYGVMDARLHKATTAAGGVVIDQAASHGLYHVDFGDAYGIGGAQYGGNILCLVHLVGEDGHVRLAVQQDLLEFFESGSAHEAVSG